MTHNLMTINDRKEPLTVETLTSPRGLDQARRPGKGLTPLVARQLAPCQHQAALVLLHGKYDCMTSPLFDQPQEVERLMSQKSRVPEVDVGWYVPVLERSHDALPATLTHTLLTAAQERTIFLQFNYCRHRVQQYRRAHRRKALSLEAVKQMLAWHQRAQSYRGQIAGANLALVLAMIHRMKLNDFDFADLVSEGNMALLRAIDKFDVARGFKFSTYACRAIIKAFSRLATRRHQRRRFFPVQFDPEMERSNHLEHKNLVAQQESVEELRQIIRTNAADLTPMEQRIIAQRFAVTLPQASPAITGAGDSRALTLHQVGHLIGLTKERVRQIQKNAMIKLRQALEQRALA